MFGEDANLRGGSSHAPAGAVLARRAVSGAIAIARRVATAGTLAIRLLAAGILLVVGLPLLTVLLYSLGYPATPVPLPIVILVDALQVLIVAYAIVAGVQFLAYAGMAVTRFGRSASRLAPPPDERAPGGEVRATSDSASLGWAALRQGALRLADMIWEQEQHGRAEFGPAALAYVRDAVTLEVEHRRQAAVLERRAGELEAWIAQDSVVASERM
jgi:hypothetical protein